MTATGAEQLVDAATLRSLLEGMSHDRTAIGEGLTRDVLETLCGIALDLELTERIIAANPDQASGALESLRLHITDAAKKLRALPGSLQFEADPGGVATMQVHRCLGRYADTMPVELRWQAPDRLSERGLTALLWLVQELLFQLHTSTAGSAQLSVVAEAGRLRGEMQCNAAVLGDGRSAWAQRCTVRLALDGGSMQQGRNDDGSWLRFELPA